MRKEGITSQLEWKMNVMGRNWVVKVEQLGSFTRKLETFVLGNARWT